MRHFTFAFIIFSISLTSCLSMVDPVPIIDIVIDKSALDLFDSIQIVSDSITSYNNDSYSVSTNKSGISQRVFWFSDNFTIKIFHENRIIFKSKCFHRISMEDKLLISFDGNKFNLKHQNKSNLAKYFILILILLSIIELFKVILPISLLKPKKKFSFVLKATLFNSGHFILIILLLFLSLKLEWEILWVLPVLLGIISIGFIDYAFYSSLDISLMKRSRIFMCIVLSNILYVFVGLYVLFLFLLYCI